MSDPRRLLEDAAELSSDERRALEAGMAAKPPPEAKRDVLAAILAGLPNGAAGPDGSAPADGGGIGAGAGVPEAVAGAGAAGAGGALALVKPAVLGVVLGLTATAGWVALRPAEPPHDPAAAPAPVEAPRRSTPTKGAEPGAPAAEREPARAEALDEPRDRARSLASAAPDIPQGPSVGSFSDGNERGPEEAAALNESKRVAGARALLRAGNAAAALAALERLRAEYPQGALVQEREALAIEALLASGDRATARARATDFLARYPKSPHAAAARRALP